MNVTVAKVHENIFSGKAESVSASTTEGDVTVLPNHEPFVANLKAGLIAVKTSAGVENFDIDGGVLEVSNGQVTVLL
jgi:F-type H+-transporting ATPase subunit epsilon